MLPSPDAFRNARLRRQQGGRPGVDAGGRGAVRPEPDPVQPAGSRPDRHADGRPAAGDSRIRSYLAAKQPMAGGPGSADDVAEAALYLCEPASRFVTGTELVVDGGWCVSEGVREGEAPSEPARFHHERSPRRLSPSIWPPSGRRSTPSRRPQLPAIREAAAHFAATILKGRLVHVFGTGHSRMAVEEMFPRYGSFPGFHPIVELSMTYHNPVVGANGQRQAMFLENVQGFGPVLWRNFATSPDDCLLAISTSGCNAVTIDVALEAKRLGMCRRGPDIAGARRGLDLAARVGQEAARGRRPGARPASPRPATRPSGSTAWRRRSRRFRASPAARSSTWSRPRSPACSPRPAPRPRS